MTIEADQWQVASFGGMPPVPDHDAVLQMIGQHTERLGRAGSLDEGTYNTLDELVDAWVDGWTTRVKTDHTEHHAAITAHRNRMSERLVKAEASARYEQEELGRIRAAYLASLARLSGDRHGQPGSPAAPHEGDDGADVVAAAHAATARRGWAEPQLLAGHSRGLLALVGVLIPVGATTDTVAFRLTLEAVLKYATGALPWIIAIGATSMSLVAAFRLGIGLSVRRRSGRRSLLTVCSTLAVWLALGLAMFLIRWRDAGTAPSLFGGQSAGIQATPLVAVFFGAIYLISGACTIFEAERIYNPEYSAFRRLRRQNHRQAEKVADADAAVDRARHAVADADDEFKREDQRREAAITARRALGDEAKHHARFLMSVWLRNPKSTYVPDDPQSDTDPTPTSADPAAAPGPGGAVSSA